jgi:hypothetical protein
MSFEEGIEVAAEVEVSVKDISSAGTASLVGGSALDFRPEGDSGNDLSSPGIMSHS